MDTGERVGRYTIEALLGAGGMGEVYRAYDEVLRRRVAIKLLRTDVGDPSDVAANVRRILREARMAASLEHPNVVAIYDVSEQAGMSFIVMELIKGRSLRSLVGPGAGAPVAERLRWLVDGARALAAAHRAGLIHRDIKPENILLRDDGVVKVLDFGIAREVSNLAAAASAARVPVDRSPAAWTGAREGESAIAGTPAYMAPEQVRGEPLDARVDQFAWGVTAYEVLTGRLPWTGEAASLLTSVLHQAPPPLDAASLGVPPAVVLAVARAMRKSRDERFASMDELLSAMGAPGPESSQNLGALAILPTASSPQLVSAPTEMASAPTELATRSAGSLALPVTAPDRVGRSRARAGALLAALLVAGTVAIWGVRHRAPASVSPPTASASGATLGASPLAFRAVEARRLTFDLGCEEFPVLTPDGRTVVFSTEIEGVEQIVALDLASGARRTLTSGPGAKMAPALSPDGTRVAYLMRRSEARGVYVVPLDGSSAPRLVHPGGIVRPLWSPDGQALWVGNGSGAARVQVDGGGVTREIEAPAASELMRVLEIADGSAVGIALAQNHLSTLGLFSYAPASGAPSPLVSADVEEALALSHDGTQLLFSKVLPTGAVELWHVPVRGGAAASVGDSSIQPTKGLSIVGDRIVWSTCRTQQTLAALRPDPGKSHELRAEPLAPPSEWEDVGGATIASDPTSIALLSTRSGKRQPWVIDLTGARAARMIPTGDLDVQNLTVSPDGKWIGFIAAGKGVFVEPADGSAPPHAVTAHASDSNPSITSDDRTVYFETDGASGRRAVGAVSLAGDAAQAVRIVLESALGPSASPVDGRILYIEPSGRGSEGVPRLLDTASGRSRVLSAAVASGDHPGTAWSPDGTRIAVSNGLQEILEVDAQRGALLRHYRSGDALLDGMAYAGKDLFVVLGAFAGDVWTARDASGAP